MNNASVDGFVELSRLRRAKLDIAVGKQQFEGFLKGCDGLIDTTHGSEGV
jgi:hypothetical protein